MKKLLILTFLNVSILCNAQNLVPNSSFTNYSSCQSALQNAHPWYTPSVWPNTPDFFHTCSNTVPSSSACYQDDHTGVGGGFVGIAVFGYPGCPTYCSELMQVELTDTLQANHYYCIEYYASLAEYISDIGIKNLGAFLSDTAVFFPLNSNVPGAPSVENSDTIFLTDTMNWMHIHAYYLAHGGEKFLTIGYFRDSANTSYTSVNNIYPDFDLAYYLIDDVSVINCDSLFIGLPEQGAARDIKVYPNPASNSVTFETRLQGSHLMIMDVTGKEVMNIKCKNEVTTINTEPLTSGIYFYSYSSSTQSPIMGRLSIIK